MLAYDISGIFCFGEGRYEVAALAAVFRRYEIREGLNLT
jgi:hypothetical protein